MILHAPVRAARRYVQHVQAPAAEVFPLLCPVREIEWVEGWMPSAVYSSSGVAELDCVFTMPEGDAEATWVVTEYTPNHRIAFVKIRPGVLVTRITIALREDEHGETEAEVSYTYTALNGDGETFVEQMTEQAYAQFMQTWESALNDYLQRQKNEHGE